MESETLVPNKTRLKPSFPSFERCLLKKEKGKNVIEENDERFFYNEQKLDFIIKHLKLDATEIAKLFGVKPAYISKLRDARHDSLKEMHLYAFTGAFNIPFKIFDTKVKTTQEIKSILEEEKNKKRSNQIFKSNKQLLDSIQGDWYAYFYPSNRFADIYKINTTFHLDGTLSDQNNNQGRLLIGTNQSIIVKEAFNSKNLITIVFDNHQVAYEMFHFSLLSKRNHVNREMFNFGFFSRKEIELDMVKDILGDKERVQLKMECDFIERISEYVEIIG